MKQTKILMGMPVTVEILDYQVTQKTLKMIWDYFKYIDQKFSTFKRTSEVSLINSGKIKPVNYSLDMQTILKLAEQTKQQTHSYFDIFKDGQLDPSGIVKGWVIYQAAQKLTKMSFKNFYIEAGGDVQVSGQNSSGKKWRIGIKNPFNQSEIIKVVEVNSEGVATSGTYIRGQHIYDPHTNQVPKGVVSLTVIGPNIYEADRFATAAFAMGRAGINFIEQLPDFEGYQVDEKGVATQTSNFEKYAAN